jgi:hypothetical protein
MTTPATQRCAHHPERQAFAICMSCRTTLCQECATQWDGIWHCAACLAKKRRGTRKRSSVAGWLTVAAASAGLFYLSIRVMVWTGALLAGLR